ncbi:UNVERIFIED_CONTAM: Retrovirus-related Pol polyprotein from transposon TNT 1-94 [Sesamum radiatum]|uniref:Retrovirus-related Pol polyprotein from transposon TNT 1-94 n=1 Tax=Sesamum radiatum TaxID=300843 RepID=A0AAW2T9H8_SESRA
MTNEIQKQYDRLEDVPSIMLCMKDVYAVPDRHIRYAATKAFFGTKMIEGSSVQSHGVTMLSLVEKLEDLKAGLNNDTRGFDLQGKGARRWKRKKGKGTAVTATASTGGAPVALKGKGKGKVLQRSRKLSKDEMVLRLGDGKDVAAEAVGSLSLVGKMTKKPFVGQSAIAKGLLDLVHTDVCGPLSVSARGGFSYFITFIDDHSRYGYVYLMRYKSEAFERFKEYRLEVENQTNRKIKALRSDRGGEYLSGEFIDYLKENGILSQWTPPRTLQLNGVAERRNRTLLEMVRSMMSFTELPPSFWGHTLETVVKLLNISPSKSIPQTPYEIWHGKPASYKYLRVWGSPTYVKRLVGDKLDSRSSLCRFVGYPKETTGYYFYDPTEQKVFVSRNAVFLEKSFPSDNQRDEVLIEESSGEPPHDSTASFEPTNYTDGVPILRRSTRESRVPERYGFVGLTSQLDNDPKTYGEAISDIDSDKWLEAIKFEMDSMGSNEVWTLIDPPKGVRSIGYKWVYKRKLGADGEVTAFKARLVAKGYTQRPGVNFEETYSPVAMAKSIRILLAIAAWYDYEIWQMDIKTAFLNGFVEEEIFMDQPEGFTTVGEEQKICRLQRSIYGLKQASRSCNTHFDEVIRGYDFVKNDYDPCVYKKISGSSIAYLVLYVDDILLIENDVKMLGDIKVWLSTQFLHEGHG